MIDSPHVLADEVHGALKQRFRLVGQPGAADFLSNRICHVWNHVPAVDCIREKHEFMQDQGWLAVKFQRDGIPMSGRSAGTGMFPQGTCFKTSVKRSGPSGIRICPSEGIEIPVIPAGRLDVDSFLPEERRSYLLERAKPTAPDPAGSVTATYRTLPPGMPPQGPCVQTCLEHIMPMLENLIDASGI